MRPYPMVQPPERLFTCWTPRPPLYKPPFAKVAIFRTSDLILATSSRDLAGGAYFTAQVICITSALVRF